MNQASDWAWPTSSIAANRAWACGLRWLHALITWRSMARSSAFRCSRAARRSAGSPANRSVVMAGLLHGGVDGLFNLFGQAPDPINLNPSAIRVESINPAGISLDLDDNPPALR